jgi:glutamyl-tRNA synthetase
MKYTTRIAPSPTGDMHIGTARTAYFNWLAARATGGKFILRIDDTDASRNSQSSADDILKIMDWLGLDYDQLVYQSNRHDLYIDKAIDLIDKGLAKRMDGAIFLDPKVIRDSWDDSVAKTIKINDNDKDLVKKLVLVKSDEVATYNFASVVDDIDLGINYVIRGNDHLANTIKQIAIYDAFGIDIPKYAHVGLIHKNKKKISKRDGAASMLTYRDLGFDPDALLNFMLRMGWGPKVDDRTTRVITKDRALDLFLDGGNLRAAPAGFDQAKLDFLGKKYRGIKKQNSNHSI